MDVSKNYQHLCQLQISVLMQENQPKFTLRNLHNVIFDRKLAWIIFLALVKKYRSVPRRQKIKVVAESRQKLRLRKKIIERNGLLQEKKKIFNHFKNAFRFLADAKIQKHMLQLQSESTYAHKKSVWHSLRTASFQPRVLLYTKTKFMSHSESQLLQDE